MADVPSLARIRVGSALQDMYPCEPDKPLPIAVRTRLLLRSCGA
ncbi:hypothetical protein [Streptomyces sp. NPDC001315]